MSSVTIDPAWPSFLPALSKAPEWARWVTISFFVISGHSVFFWWADEPAWHAGIQDWYHSNAVPKEEWRHEVVHAVWDVPSMPTREAIWRIPGR